MISVGEHDLCIWKKPLHELTKKQWNSLIVGGKTIGTYSFVRGYYGLTVMPTEFQKSMDPTLAIIICVFVYNPTLVNIICVFVYIDSILIVAEGTKTEHLIR